MNKLTLDAFIELCQLNKNKKYVQELCEITRISECYFEPGVVMPQDQIASLYKLRLDIAKEHRKFDDDYIEDFERTVLNLQNSKSKNLGVAWVNTENDSSYLIFYEPESFKILGILKSKRRKDSL
jgi:hypothetical protein